MLPLAEPRTGTARWPAGRAASGRVSCPRLTRDLVRCRHGLIAAGQVHELWTAECCSGWLPKDAGGAAVAQVSCMARFGRAARS